MHPPFTQHVHLDDTYIRLIYGTTESFTGHADQHDFNLHEEATPSPTHYDNLVWRFIDMEN